MQKACEDSKKVKKQALMTPFCPLGRFNIARTSSEGDQHALASPGYCIFRHFLSDLGVLVLSYELICSEPGEASSQRCHILKEHTNIKHKSHETKL